MASRFFLILLISIGLSEVYAQSDSLNRKTTYYNTFLSGTMIGCGDCINGKDFTLTFTTFHGVSFPTGIRLGIGTGLDVYNEWRMIPLLAGITVDKARRSNTFYFHLNSGYAFGSYLRQENQEGLRFTDDGGFTINPMLGYRIGNEKIRLYVQAGYKYQRAFSGLYWSGGQWGSPYSIERAYELQRVVVQLGFGIN